MRFQTEQRGEKKVNEVEKREMDVFHNEGGGVGKENTYVWDK